MKRTQRPLPARSTSKTATGAPAPRRAAVPTGAWGRLRAWATATDRGPLTHRLVRGLLMLFAFSLPLLYDLSVPEVSGDIRWSATHLVAGLGLLLLLGQAIYDNRGRPALRMPWLGWFAAGLAVWAGVSMVDSLNFDRGIVLIKALVAQLLIIGIAYRVWRPGFDRGLMWALALPVGFIGFLGSAQFFGWSDASFANSVLPAWLGWVWPQGYVIDPLVAFYQQSAVPGASFANKNLAGSWTAMMIPIVLYLLMTTRSRVAKVLASALLAIGAVFLLYSRARASWIALVFGLLMLGVGVAINPAWREQLHRHGAPWRWVWALPAVVLVAWQFNVTSPLTNTYAVSITPQEQMGNLLQAKWDDVGGRLAYNLNSLMIVKDYWFNGVGLGAFYTIYPAYHDAIVPTPANSYSVLARPQRTHTDLVQAFDEMGIPGGILYAGVFVIGLLYAWRLRTRTGVAEGGVWPLFAGISLLTIGSNSLMDFPMQLPTAPAVVALLLGGLMWHHQRVYPGAVWALPQRLKLKTLRLGRPGLAALWLLSAAVLGWAMWDNWKFREANQLLKGAMIRIMSGITDDSTLELVTAAQKAYPYDPRIHEHLGVTYANYNGTRAMPLEERIAQIEWVVKGDPWGANHLINLAGQYLMLADVHLQRGDRATAERALDRVEELHKQLRRSAGFSSYYYGIGGMLALLRGQLDLAAQNFQRALEIDPGYGPAQGGLQRIQMLMNPAAVTPVGGS